MLNLYREKSRVGILVKCLRENYRLFNAVEIKVFKGGINMKTFLGFTTGVFAGIILGMNIIYYLNEGDEDFSCWMAHNGKWYKKLMSENKNKKA